MSRLTQVNEFSGNVCIRRLDLYRDLLPLHATQPQRYPYLLESVAHGTSQARYDILFAFPGRTLIAQPDGADFLHAFDAWWAGEKKSGNELPALPFRGGWFLFLAYELAKQIEPHLPLIADASSLPMAFATRVPAAIIRDHEEKCLYLMAEAGHAFLLDDMQADVLEAETAGSVRPDVLVRNIEEDPPSGFIEGVERIKHYIHEGDVFQVNLSRAWRARIPDTGHYTSLYEALRLRNPAPFAGLAIHEGTAILSSSPERLVKVDNDVIETRPIAGTRPRSAESSMDQAYSRALLAHPKERAEHVMLIDLERNDLGRVCVPGSVEVNELMTLESYAHVHHIVSNVRGRKREDVTPGQVIRAVFPGGTITGCPKVRCMEIIAELEQTSRGAYTGSMGYVNRDGGMDLNILIRTMVVQGSQITLRAGAGIVADSIPEKELEETRAKARGLLLALTCRK